jgi:TolB-like protein
MESFGPYTVFELLGESALGRLHRARDTRIGRTVALRFVSPAITGVDVCRDAFLVDATAATALNHPHIAALFDFGEDEGQIFLAHEFVPGQTMESLLKGQPIDIGVALEFAVQIADGLAEGHRQGVTHGDVRPGTVIVTPKDQAKIVDFGVASWSSGGSGRRTVGEQLAAGFEPSDETGDRLVAYMSPEQLLGGRADVRTDVFSLGILLYHMLTGRAPFEGNSASGTAVKILQCTPPPPTRQNPQLPAGFDRIISRALAKSLDERYPDASVMAAELRVLAAEINVPVTVEVQRQKQKRLRVRAKRHWKRALVATLAAAGIVAAAAGAWYGRGAIWRLFAGRTAAPTAVVVVLPFGMADGDTEKAYYGVGFAEELASRLGEVPGLRVVGRSSIRDTPAPSAAELGRRVGAAYALRGSTRPGQYALHVNVELVDIATGETVWSQNYSREPRQAPGAEAEIAKQIAEQLGLPVPAGNRWARAQLKQVQPAAYDLYLQARDAAARRDRSRAIELYRQAIDTDARLVEARVGLSEALYLEDFYSGNNGDAGTLDHAREEAEAALAVDPDMARAHLAAALAAPTTVSAASSLARALALDPSLGEAWHHAGDLILALDPSRSIAYYRRSLELDPGIDSSYRDIASAFEMLGSLPDAEKALAYGQGARPDRPWWTQMRARLDMVRGEYGKAADLLRADRASESTPFTWLFGRVVPLRMAFRADEAGADAVRLVDRYPWFCEGRAVLAGLELEAGEAGKARALTDAIYEQTAMASAGPALLQCAAVAAAGRGEGLETAGYLVKIAHDDRALRAWTRPSLFGIELSFRRRWYPWSKVTASPPVQQAGTELAQALQRLKEETATRLPLPPTPAPQTSRQ